jgi:hypothetical protein
MSPQVREQIDRNRGTFERGFPAPERVRGGSHTPHRVNTMMKFFH